MRVFKNYAPKQIAKYVVAFLKVNFQSRDRASLNLTQAELWLK